MSVQGLCHVCENAPGRYSCKQCGGVACPAHYDEKAQLCGACAATGGGPLGPDEIRY